MKSGKPKLGWKYWYMTGKYEDLFKLQPDELVWFKLLVDASRGELK